MDDIKHVVYTVVKGCAHASVEVSDVLAAFIARTVVDTNSAQFSLDRKLSPEAVNEVILLSIEKLLEKNNPALEM